MVETMDEDDLNNLHYVLRAYFVDSDYTFEGVLGQGGNGVTYKIGGYGRQRFALKVCPQDTELLRDADGGEDDGPPEALRQLRSEADWLWVSVIVEP